MVRLIPKQSRAAESTTTVCDVLLVRVPPEMVTLVSPDLLSRAESGRETLALLKLARFRMLLTSLDVPDMPPWELFRRAKRMQSQLQCVLMDERLTADEERRLRQTGAGAFATSDPAIFAAAVRPVPT